MNAAAPEEATLARIGHGDHAVLTTGQPVDIAVAGPDDLDRVRQFYEQLSDTSTYYRFFGIRRALPERELRAVVSGQAPARVTLLASLGEELIGIGELIGLDAARCHHEQHAAEVAFAVADTHHRQGVATLLLERLAHIGRELGLDRLVAKTLPGNADMLLVFRTVGLAQRCVFEDGVITVSLDLGSLDELDRQAAGRLQLAHDRPGANPDHR